MQRRKPVKVGNRWITSTYKNFPISRLQDEERSKARNGKKTKG